MLEQIVLNDDVVEATLEYVINLSSEGYRARLAAEISADDLLTETFRDRVRVVAMALAAAKIIARDADFDEIKAKLGYRIAGKGHAAAPGTTGVGFLIADEFACQLIDLDLQEVRDAVGEHPTAEQKATIERICGLRRQFETA